MNLIQLNSNTATINVLCRYDSTSSAHKTIIEISGQPMHYVWYNMPPNSTIQDLLCKIRKIYRLNISSVDDLDASTAILDIQSNAHPSDPCIWRYIEALKVNLNTNETSNRLQFKLSSLLTHSDGNMLKDKIYSFLDEIYCPLQCEIQYNETHSNIYNDIPNKQQMIEFLSNIPQQEMLSSPSDDRQLSINISLPCIQLKINHKQQIFYFYGFKNILFLCDNKFEEYASKIINNKYQINYNDVLELFNIDGYTFMDPNNQYLELDLYQRISPLTIGVAPLQTKSLSLHKCNRCVICQQDNVSQSEFTRINCCEHQYHYSCIKQYIQHNSKAVPQCPLCRKPFTLIQVHNNLVLQTIEINNSEFKSDHERQDSDVNSFFSDLEDNDELIAVAHDLLPPLLPLAPNFDDLDEFYRVGLSIINSTSNHDIDNIDTNEDDDDDDDNYNNAYVPPIDINEEESDDDRSRNHEERSRDHISKSSYSGDKIGRLSLSGLSTSATQSTPTRPSLRYVYSPLPFSDRDSPIAQQYSPTPTLHSRSKNRSLSGSSSPSQLNNNALNIIPLRSNDHLTLYPIDSLQSMSSHVLLN